MKAELQSLQVNQKSNVVKTVLQMKKKKSLFISRWGTLVRWKKHSQT